MPCVRSFSRSESPSIALAELSTFLPNIPVLLPMTSSSAAQTDRKDSLRLPPWHRRSITLRFPTPIRHPRHHPRRPSLHTKPQAT
ncbi:hypothetical protein BDQ94DRAFT_163692 [Aspergillus welwitschiae]|uniref:Uncharacterized protein n=1 Tax=Aspergillus welwitschiae TaxID=1341132 RepID=A0A3F3PKA3_9EURO|nr:hypothetical protein BDQ94DRAFT_163692 [Aspergillus welwitschiae]RDH27375.1 hypothetical protein BDQ94DRAFT_163692 [Aspergillus welwitschiae]